MTQRVGNRPGPPKQTGSRTMVMSYKAQKITIREGHDGRLEFNFGDHAVTPEAKSFEAATNEARRWLLDNAGKMRGNYDRDN